MLITEAHSYEMIRLPSYNKNYVAKVGYSLQARCLHI